MSSIEPIVSPRDGARSTGSKTPGRKRKSSPKGMRSLQLSAIVVTGNESGDVFDEAFGDLFHQFEPTNASELLLIENMASSCWRLRRLWAIENTMMDAAIQKVNPADGMGPFASGFSRLAESSHFGVLQRYAANLDRTYQRALRNLVLLRKKAAQPKEVRL